MSGLNVFKRVFKSERKIGRQIQRGGGMRKAWSDIADFEDKDDQGPRNVDSF
jgi:hypothetical protein